LEEDDAVDERGGDGSLDFGGSCGDKVEKKRERRKSRFSI